MNPHPRSPEFGIVPRAFFALLAAGPALAQTTERVSLDPSGAQVTLTTAFGKESIDISDDGSLACFMALPSGGTVKLYARNLEADETTVIHSGGANNVVVYGLAMSGDGSSVVASYANPPVPGFPADNNGTNDIYSFQTADGTPTWVSITAGGVAPNVPSWDPDVSEDGNEVTWSSYAAAGQTPSNMTADPVPLNSAQQVYFRQLPGGTTRLISITPGGTGGNSRSDFPRISDDGRYVAFQSDASDLVAGDTNGNTDVFVWDELLETLTLVSRNDMGVQANGRSIQPSISADGRFVLYRSNAGNLGTGAQSGFDSLWVLDRDMDMDGDLANTNGVTTLVSKSSLGVPVYNGFLGYWPTQLSDDGNQVLFHRLGYNGLEPNPNGFFQVWLHDRTTGQTTNVHVDSDGRAANSSADFQVALSGDGSRAIYRTNATNLDPVLPDTNGQIDVYAHEICQGATKDLGNWLAGTGGLKPEFTVCGGLGTGEKAEFRLRRALPFANAMLILSPTKKPVTTCGTQFLPGGGAFRPIPSGIGKVLLGPAGPIPMVRIGTTNALGEITLTYKGGGGPATLYGQWIVADPGGCMGKAFSNALEIQWDP